jgi:hypothetical protein
VSILSLGALPVCCFPLSFFLLIQFCVFPPSPPPPHFTATFPSEW